MPGAGVDETLIWFEHIAWNNVERRFLLSDPRGSVVAVTDDMGAATSINRYDEYGAPHANNAGRFGFTGQMQLTDFGLWHYKARAYHSGMGRFLQTDPIGYGDGMNMYNYVGGDPVNMVDPTGLREKTQLANCRGQADCIVVVGERPSYSYGDLTNSIYFSNNQGIDVSGIPDHIVVTAERKTEDEGECSAPLTSQERQMSEQGNRLGFWESRLAQRDPIAQTALDIYNDAGLGAVANRRLRNAINPATMGAGTRFMPYMPPLTAASVNDIGVALMQGHVEAIDRFPSQSGVLNPRQIADYHHNVFSDFNLPSSTFGGTPLFGGAWEASLTQSLWYDGCE